MKKIRHLEVDDILQLYDVVMEKYGGVKGIRDRRLLESALAQPQVILFGEMVYKNLYEIGAAYFFYIIKNHPFIDGNKRVGLLATLTFFEINGFIVEVDSDSLYQLTQYVADSTLTLEDVAKFFEESSKKASKKL
jgi:death-on-curing protein